MFLQKINEIGFSEYVDFFETGSDSLSLLSVLPHRARVRTLQNRGIFSGIIRTRNPQNKREGGRWVHIIHKIKFPGSRGFYRHQKIP